ncbi:two component, sigma54 specific, transcriptional regulator, Fis family [Rhodopirellula maiorica SM1]|uniref:DNA-binding transcriptional regulator NtrC n=1 Tax=Rhodopirellula maiorica SM1 TaxID=1265738 RepID=M5R763_9BACT|nr:sigma-54 dependent transcriptional regulator [Rhodopirellula maiorica]EMI15313.1 two component, sigma54 specific, transcriptional regulator, Fis family [Rhodopirellula maiorica SM1]
MNAKRSILVVDDEPSICWGFERLLSGAGHEVLIASSAEDAIEIAQSRPLDLILLDVRLPGEDGITALPKLQAATNGAPVIVMTAFGDLETAVGAVHAGACDYLTKPFRLEDAAKACEQALRVGGRLAPDEPETTPPSDASLLVGKSAAMQQVFRQIALVADSDLSVLITGETGTGKELAAAAIHRHSRRSDKPYLPIAPVSLSETVIESELFGHVKGAFTGADSNRAGLFELASEGSILLDEIGELPLAIQAKLLRVLEQGEFTAVGDVAARRSNVRIIAATNRDLEQAVHEGTFREDLLYRLSAVSIRLPPLRHRSEDIPMLIEYFLTRLGYPSPKNATDPSLIDALQQRSWWGNVRELRNAVEHASVIARGRPLLLSDFPEERQNRSGTVDAPTNSLSKAVASWTTQELAAGSENLTDLNERFQAAAMPTLLRLVLEHTDGNRAAAADMLGIHRGTLREWIKRYPSETETE